MQCLPFVFTQTACGPAAMVWWHGQMFCPAVGFGVNAPWRCKIWPQMPCMDPDGQISVSLPRLLQIRSRQHSKAALTLRWKPAGWQDQLCNVKSCCWLGQCQIAETRSRSVTWTAATKELSLRWTSTCQSWMTGGLIENGRKNAPDLVWMQPYETLNFFSVQCHLKWFTSDFTFVWSKWRGEPCDTTLCWHQDWENIWRWSRNRSLDVPKKPKMSEEDIGHVFHEL